MKYTYMQYFNIKVVKSDKNKLTRDNYCTPTNKVSSDVTRVINNIQDHYKTYGEYPKLAYSKFCQLPNDIFIDSKHFTDEYVKSHYEKVMYNYDLNINYFNKLDYDEFNAYLNKFTKKNRFKEVFDLSQLNEVCGIYILVLDNYKQVYIGLADRITKRIRQHWNAKKEFDKLIFGEPETSILSIDSFGALDTTRIFYKKVSYYSIDETKKKYISLFDKKYLLNRTAGGLNALEYNGFRAMAAKNQRNVRKL